MSDQGHTNRQHTLAGDRSTKGCRVCQEYVTPRNLLLRPFVMAGHGRAAGRLITLSGWLRDGVEGKYVGGRPVDPWWGTHDLLKGFAGDGTIFVTGGAGGPAPGTRDVVVSAHGVDGALGKAYSLYEPVWKRIGKG